MIESVEKYLKPLSFIPILAMNGTLSVIESLQRYVYCDKEEVVGVVSEVKVAPVRTLKMLSVESWEVTTVGLKHNKRLAVYLQNPELVRLYGSTKMGSRLTGISCKFTDQSCENLCLSYEGYNDLVLCLPDITNGERVFGMKFKELSSDGREYINVGKKADEWMTAVLGGEPVTVLYVPDRKLSGERNFPIYVAPNNMPVPVPPVLITSISTLEKMNKQAGTAVEMERFRSNVVVTGCEAEAENFWKIIRIGDQLELEQTFMSPRCGVINAYRGELNNKVIDTVRKFGPFRDTRNRACFGSYWKVLRPGKVSVGDKIVLLKSMDSEITGPYVLSNKFLLG
jgi:hypothetical protein